MKRLIYLFLISTFFIYGSSCSKDEPAPSICDAVICLHGGVCDEQGNCNCPPDYEGDNCKDLTKPKEIKISKITVISFDENNPSDQAWDTDDGPDLYVVFSKLDLFFSIDETAVIDNCESGREYEFPVEWSMDGEVSEYYFVLLDDDPDVQLDGFVIVGNADWMGELKIEPMDYRKEQPTTIELLPQSNDRFGLRLEVEWIFD